MCNVDNLITSIITHDIAPREPSACRGNPILPRRLGEVETFSIGRVLGLVGCGAHENSTVKRAQVAAIQGWVTSLGSFHPGNQKQIREPGGAERTISNTAGCYRWYQRQGPNPCDQRGR
ncbi:hypothetical protein E3N88_25879 [Mikania micrantha]|uniref:Uncharacterized protein n=1 Tax=Mikania micrantha TaxID=192012 RepID=A0A5N6N7K5_9ASTR|nr:hypothetical protein E3N88_25879 [Mikania micrantha]